MKRFFKVTLWSLLAVLLVFIVLTAISFGPFIKGAASVQKLDEGLYYMEYSGDDGFNGLLENGGGSSSDELLQYIIPFITKGHYNLPAPEQSGADFGCSSLTVSTPDGDVLMGRNFDFPSATALILHTKPKTGYETITTFNVEFFNMGEGWRPEGFMNQYISLAGLFFALDGFNEKGLAIADLMAGDNAVTHQDTGKPDLTTSSAIPFLLKNASDVDEALYLLSIIDMHSDIGAAHHYAMSDANGKSVVVEYVNNRMVVVKTPAVTNHYLCDEKHNVGLMEQDKRYDYLCKRFETTGGVMDEKNLNTAIFSVSQAENEHSLGTAWTMVMNLTQKKVTYYSRRHYDNPFIFSID